MLDYVHDNTLCLQSYTLSMGHCNALAKAFQYFDGFINRAIFDNCGIDDDEFASILGGILKLKDFKKIIYRYNTVHRNSLGGLAALLERKIPNHLEELRIENCKIEPSITTALIEAINQKCYLAKLALVNAKFTVEAFDKLCLFVEESPHL